MTHIDQRRPSKVLRRRYGSSVCAPSAGLAPLTCALSMACSTLFLLPLAGCDDDCPPSPGVDAGGSADAAPPPEDGGGDSAVPEPPSSVFQIGLWCGIPSEVLDETRVRQVKDAAFTFTSFPCNESDWSPYATQADYNLALLELAEGVGLGVEVADSRTWDADAIDDVAGDYAASPALAYYHVADEPSAALFGVVATITEELERNDPDHPALTNLFPNYATQGQLRATSYDEYVAAFLSTARPGLFSYDHYHFLDDGRDGELFFANLESVRAAGVGYRTPFFNVIQSVGFSGHRQPSAAEKRWLAMHTLAYGAAGLVWFTYWTPTAVESFLPALIDRDGNETEHYAEVAAINRDVSVIGGYLSAAEHLEVYHNGTLALAARPRVPGDPVYVLGPAPLTVGRFRVGEDEYALVVNRDHDASTAATVYLQASDGAPEVLDVGSGRFVASPVEVRDEELGVGVAVEIPAGDARLFHLRGPVPMGPGGAEVYVGMVREGVGYLHVVDSRWPGDDRSLYLAREAGWGTCPLGHVEVGRNEQFGSFWLCARSDLYARTFHVGTVEGGGDGYWYGFANGVAADRVWGRWDDCPKNSQLLGHHTEQETGEFWVCMN